MSTNRPYREALPYDVIQAEIRGMSGRQFDPALVEVFLTVPPAVWEDLAAGHRQKCAPLRIEKAELTRAA